MQSLSSYNQEIKYNERLKWEFLTARANGKNNSLIMLTYFYSSNQLSLFDIIVSNIDCGMQIFFHVLRSYLLFVGCSDKI